MNKKEIAEIRRRFSKSQATFSRLAGCYVDGQKNKVCTFNGPFLTLEDEEYYKYLEIAKKTLSGTLDNQLLNLDFPLDEERAGGHQQFLYGILTSKLSEETLESWYDLVIESYEHTGNYLILLFLDSYDVPFKGADDLYSGESNDVYTYMLAAVCPVELSKAALGYIEEEKRIGSRIRDWVVHDPETGFLFPAFNARGTDIHSCLFYTKDTREPHREFMEKVLGCGAVRTTTEKKITFRNIVSEALGEDNERNNDLILKLESSLNDLNNQYEEAHDGEDVERLSLAPEILSEALSDSGIPAEKAEKIGAKVQRAFADAEPPVEAVIDAREIRANEMRLERNELLRTLNEKERELKEIRERTALDGGLAAGVSDDGFSVRITVDEDRAERVRFDYIDGERYVLIPVEENESVAVNGEEAEEL